MDKDEKKVISTLEDLDEFFAEMCSDIDKAFKNSVSVDFKSMFKPIEFRIPCDEDVPYIDTPWMSAFVEYSKNLVGTIEKGLKRRLTHDEMSQVQFRVYVSKGSIVLVALSELGEFLSSSGLSEVLPEMSWQQILAFTVPVAIAAGVCYGLSKFQMEKTQRNKDNLDAQIKSKEIEAQAKLIESQNARLVEVDQIAAEREAMLLENQKDVLNTIKEIYSDCGKVNKDFAKDVLSIPNLPDEITINGERTTKQDLQEMAKVTRPRKEKKIVVVEDYFKAVKLDYENPNGNEYLFSTPTKNIKDCCFRADMFDKYQQFAIDKRYRLKLRFECVEKGGELTRKQDSAIMVLGYANEEGEELTMEDIRSEMDNERS